MLLAEQLFFFFSSEMVPLLGTFRLVKFQLLEKVHYIFSFYSEVKQVCGQKRNVSSFNNLVQMILNKII